MSASDSDLEKTELPSQHKLDQAREEGHVPRSRELSACLSLLSIGGILWLAGSSLQAELSLSLQDSLSFNHTLATDPGRLCEQVAHTISRLIWRCLPWSVAVFLLNLLAPFMAGGWLFSFKHLGPRFSRLDPIAGIGRLVSAESMMELGKAMIKVSLVGGVAWLALSQEIDKMSGMASLGVGQQSRELADLLISVFLSMAGTLGLIAALDVRLQRWRHTRQLMMTRDELRREHREHEGNPEVKGRLRSLQREMARRRMMAAIPSADVVITNPTHYAVAISYAESSNSAPRVVAKGIDQLAAKIRQRAEDHHIPLLASPSLARALYWHVEIGDAIPEKLYTAVAQVLAYVFQLRAGHAPEQLGHLAVPEDLSRPRDTRWLDE